MRTFIMSEKMSQTDKLNIGDLVEIKDNTHDESIPETRAGIIVSEHNALVHYTNTHPIDTGIRVVLMTNGKKIKVHKMFLQRINIDG